MFKRRYDATADIAAVVRAEGDTHDLEARPVMQFEELHHQVGDGVLTEISRHVGQANPIVRSRRALIRLCQATWSQV